MVPFPSAARMDPLANESAVVPAFFALNVIAMMVPRVENGLGVPPLKEMVPPVFEYDGSAVHSEKTEPSFETADTERRLASNVMVPSVALTLWPAGSTTTLTVNVFPAVNEPLAGLNESVDANAIDGDTPKTAMAIATKSDDALFLVKNESIDSEGPEAFRSAYG